MASSRNSPSIEPVAGACAAALRRHTAEGTRICIALSGGVDSVVLLQALRATPIAVPGLTALHVHHGLSANADAWARFCRELCTAWGIPIEIVHVTVERDAADGVEGAARRARHQVFATRDADFVALGHHRGDQAETLLFRLLRGTGLHGAAAMAERNGRLLRPLLGVGRSDILAYARQHRLDWIEDESNQDPTLTRNFLRHVVLPPLASRFPAAEDRLAAAARRFAEAADLLDQLAELDLGGLAAEFPLPLSLLASLAEPRARNVLRFVLAKSGVLLPSEQRLVETLRQLILAGPDRHPRIVLGKHALWRQQGMVHLAPA